jgi:hypothetical protein
MDSPGSGTDPEENDMLDHIRPFVLVAALALAVPIAGCGGSDEGSADDPAAAESQSDNDRDTARAKLEQCLRENGFEPPSEGGGGGGLAQLSEADRQELQDAITGPCAEYREDAVGDISPEQQQEFQDARAKFTDCMRDEGIELPEPSQGGGGGLAQLDADDPDVQAAMEKCQDVAPQIGRGPGGGG